MNKCYIYSMQIEVRYLENLRLEALFDDFNVISDQPIRYKGDGTAPGPFDYFLASSVLCAAYFVKVYCKARNISTDDIRVTQDNIVDPENRYKQIFKITVEIPDHISAKDKDGILAAIDRCTVKKTIQQSPEFVIEAKTVLEKNKANVFDPFLNKKTLTHIPGKDSPLEQSISKMVALLDKLEVKIEISSWRNPVPNVWSVHLRDADSPTCFSNGKGSTKEAALCSALGEYFERLSNNYFYADFFLGQEIAEGPFVHYPQEKWFSIPDSNELPDGLMDTYLLTVYNPDNELRASHLIETNSGNEARGICALPYTRWSDQQKVFIPVNLIGNLFVSNGMSAGNAIYEAKVQCLSEIFERAVKNQIITEEITLPDVPQEAIDLYPKIKAGIKGLEKKGFPILVKDASLGGRFPVMCVLLMNQKTGGVYASFGAHPNFEVALERSLTELLQGRSFEGLNEMPPPTFNQFAVTEPNNIIDHFIDSTGVLSWMFFKNQPDYEFHHWDFSGTTNQEFNHLMGILKKLEKEVYVAEYHELGIPTCRILVPEYSEVYPREDLIWDNNNLALQFRSDILQIHSLTDSQLESLLENLEESEIDDFKPVSEVIGIAFDENTTWGQLVVGELKGLINIALKRLEEAKSAIELFFTFNDHSQQRRLFYQALAAMIDIELHPQLNLNDFNDSFKKLYGEQMFQLAKETLVGSNRFPGLNETDLNLKGLDKHLKLIKSYQKIQKAKKLFYSAHQRQLFLR